MRSSSLVSIAVLLAITLVLTGTRDLGRSPAAFGSSFGRGHPIVLVHGLGSRASHWLPTARRLARTHRVVVIDLPGHGASTMPEPFSLERGVESLDRALAAQTREPVILVGHSVGGLVAAAEAIAHPERVRALVLVETALRPQVAGADRAALLSALDHDYRGLMRSAYRSFARDSVQDAALEAEVAELDSSMMRSWIRLATGVDLSARAAALNVPVLAVLAERSWAKGEPWPRTARVLGYGRIARVVPLRMGHCGHFVMLDRPIELADAIARFESELDDVPIACAARSFPAREESGIP